MRNLILTMVFLVPMIIACSKEKRFKSKIDGAWKVENLSVIADDTAGISYSVSNVGFIYFEKSGTGHNDFSYSFQKGYTIFDVKNRESFVWSYSDNQVTIVSTDNFHQSHTIWSIVKSKNKIQNWTTKDANGIVEIKLSKLKTKD